MVCVNFQNNAHTCSALNDRRSFVICNELNFSAADSVNHRRSFPKGHLGFLIHENSTPFLAVRAVLIKVRSQKLDR